MNIYIRRRSDREVVNTIDVTNKSELQIEMLIRSALMSIDKNEQYLDDSEIHNGKIEEK
jgi:hypothetical protein